MSVAGPCEWCGGPQVWTVIRGEVYTSCDNGCLPLPMEGLVPPPACEDGAVRMKDAMELSYQEEGKGTPEGRESNTSVTEVKGPEDPPQAFLDSLWEGSEHG